MPIMIDEKQTLEDFAANLQRRLDELRWTQADLAREIQIEGESFGATRVRVSRYLNAQVSPSLAMLVSLAGILGVTADWLLSSPPKKRRRSA